MTCRELIDFLMQYLDGELDAAAREEFEKHLAACPPCVAYLKTYRQAVAMGKQAYDPCEGDKQAPMPEELVRAILNAAKKPKS